MKKTLALLICSSTMLHSQQIRPESFRPYPKFDKAMLAADVALRVADTITTHSLMTDPCYCYKEANPFSPNADKLVPLVTFQAGSAALLGMATYILDNKGHHKIAKWILLLDVANEAWAVSANIKNKLNPPPFR